MALGERCRELQRDAYVAASDLPQFLVHLSYAALRRALATTGSTHW